MIYRLSLGKGGAKNLAPLLSQFSHKQLKVSKSTYNRYKRKLAKGESLPDTITKKLRKKADAKSSIRFTNNSKWTFKVPPSIVKEISNKKFIYKEKLKLNKKTRKFRRVGIKKAPAKYVWVKFQLYKNATFYKSALLEHKKAKHINKFIEMYVDAQIRQYGDEPIYITGISLEII